MEFFDTTKLLKHGQTILKLIASRYEDIKDLKYPVTPPTEPGDIRNQLPRSPPTQGESEEQIIEDVEKILLPASTYWCHPNFYAYYAQNSCHAQVISEIYGTTFSTPKQDRCQMELENLVIDWIVLAMDLPKHFLYEGTGGGVISSTASDSVFLTIQAAKKKKQSELNISNHDPRILNFVGYYSGMCHASSAKGLYFKDIPYIRDVPIVFNSESGNYEADVTAFQKILQKDLSDGLIPFWFGSAWGSTYTCGYDNVKEIGQICQAQGIWLNVDAAYAGSAWIIPEYREKVQGLELVDSIQMNFSKMMMTGLAGTITLVKNKQTFIDGMKGKQYDMEIESSDDYKDWQIGDEKRFDSFKIWWMMKSNGIEGMRRNILNKVQIAEYFETLIEKSSRWKVFTKRELSLTTFLLKDQSLDLQNRKNRRLFEMINQETSRGFVNAITVDGVFFLRCVIGSHETTTSHIDSFFSYINELADKLKEEENII